MRDFAKSFAVGSVLATGVALATAGFVGVPLRFNILVILPAASCFYLGIHAMREDKR